MVCLDGKELAKEGLFAKANGSRRLEVALLLVE